MKKIFATIALATLAACATKTPETNGGTDTTTVRVDTTSAPDSTTVKVKVSDTAKVVE